jgi:glycosyltransferase involved in cell wall biosynthesis
MKISVVVPILNEQKDIEWLMQGLAHQTLLPAEVVFVDGGSSDGTIKKIDSKRLSLPYPITLIEKKGANRSKARNIGISESKNAYIALTDAGCSPDKCWLEEFAAKISHISKVKVIAGGYRPMIDSSWSEYFFRFLGMYPHEIDRGFLPSARSMLVTKDAWKTVGGFPEQLTTCEDLTFSANLATTHEIHVAPNAVVDWKVPINIVEFFHQVASYSYGDILARYQPHVRKILLTFVRWIILVLIPFFLPVYLAYKVFSFRVRTGKFMNVWRVIVVSIVGDFGVMWGAVKAVTLRN